LNKTELKQFLDEKVIQYNNPRFIESDPIQIPHLFTVKEDIEIAAFLTATIAWGNRKSIINNAKKMMELVGNSPYDFVLNHKPHHLDNLDVLFTELLIVPTLNTLLKHFNIFIKTITD